MARAAPDDSERRELPPFSSGVSPIKEVSTDTRIAHVEVSDETIIANLVDGRVISVPLAWSWRLSDATPAQRANWRLIGDGHGVHWPDVDEDISAEGMLTGAPAPRPAQRVAVVKAIGPANRRIPATPSRRKTAARG